MEKKPLTAVVPLLLRNLITASDKPLLYISEKYKLLESLRLFLITCLLFFLRLLPSLFRSVNPNSSSDPDDKLRFNRKKGEIHPLASSFGDSGIARALSQLLAVMNDIPVSSRKYEIVRLLAETIIDGNQRENAAALTEVNRTVLSAAFLRTLNRLEAVIYNNNRGRLSEPVRLALDRVVRAARAVGDGVWGKGEVVGERLDVSAEKLAAELLWLAERMVGCGFREEAVGKWAAASNLAWLALSAEPGLQGSMVKISAFLFKQAKDMALEETEESKKEQQRQMKLKMLMSWLPLLCRASNGTDTPILSTRDRAEVEKVLEETIEAFSKEEQEQVLSLWLHHFMYFSSSDWPNLEASYARWCDNSRKLLLLQ